MADPNYGPLHSTSNKILKNLLATANDTISKMQALLTAVEAEVFYRKNGLCRGPDGDDSVCGGTCATCKDAAPVEVQCDSTYGAFRCMLAPNHSGNHEAPKVNLSW